jgi:hypothetical protein
LVACFVSVANSHTYQVAADHLNNQEAGDALEAVVQAVQTVHHSTAIETIVLPVPIGRLDNWNQAALQEPHLEFSTEAWKALVPVVQVASLVDVLRMVLALVVGVPSDMPSHVHDRESSEDHLAADTWIQAEVEWHGSSYVGVEDFRTARAAIPYTPNVVPWEALLGLVHREAVDIFPVDSRGSLLADHPWGRHP